MTSPQYSDIVATNFSSTSDTSRTSCHLLFVSGDEKRLMEAKVERDGGDEPHKVQNAHPNFNSSGSTAITYMFPHTAIEDRAIFYMRGDDEDTILRQYWTSGKGWSTAEPLSDEDKAIKVGDDAKIAVVTTGENKYTLYATNRDNRVVELTGPKFGHHGKEHWEHRLVVVDGVELATHLESSLAVAKNGMRYLLAYMDKDHVLRLAVRDGHSGHYTSKGVIHGASKKTPLAIAARPGGSPNGEPAFSVFYHKVGSKRHEITEHLVSLILSEGPTFSTSVELSGISASAVKHEPSDHWRNPGIRVFSVSNLDGVDTLFQYVRRGRDKKWVIPAGLIITKS
ncbi:hypothetical protein BDD12DRAFT_869930 [Trichophaea hybrida]|nr:hypothetical protein BDD12DRAFT_869930 [Trichophaea hybrida]